jgi:hypothetical protein
LYLDGKKCAIPSLHRDSFQAKEQGLCPDAASGNTTPAQQSGSFAKMIHRIISLRSALLPGRYGQAIDNMTVKHIMKTILHPDSLTV